MLFCLYHFLLSVRVKMRLIRSYTVYAMHIVLIFAASNDTVGFGKWYALTVYLRTIFFFFAAFGQTRLNEGTT